MKWSGRLPTLLRGLLMLLIIIAIGILPPTILDELGVRPTPKVPWLAPVQEEAQ
jgi:hypothetical protein